MTFQESFQISPFERYLRTPWRVVRKTPLNALLAPPSHICNICGWRGVFTSKTPGLLNCPLCKSSNRHRLLVWFLEHEEPALLAPGRNVLHVAPEPCLEGALAHMPGVSYTTGDLARKGVDRHFDLQHEIVAPAHFDLILINHVLEHIPDDRAAMRNLHAMLRPGGLCIVTVPIRGNGLATDEDLNVTDPMERARRFGQPDHLRYYGVDIAERLSEAGFSCTTFDAPATADPRLTLGAEILFLARRPNA